MSFKLINVLLIFQKFINQVLQKELNDRVLVYIDDIFIMKTTKEEHRKRVRRILKKLLKIELRIKFFKNEFKKKKVKFLNYIIERKEIKLDSEKIRILKK